MKKIIKINFIVCLILVICSLNCISVYSAGEIESETENYDDEFNRDYKDEFQEENLPEEEQIYEEVEEEPEEETELDGLKNQKSELDQTLSSTYMQLGLVQSQMSDVLYEIEQLNLQIIQKEEEIAKLEQEEEKVLASINVAEKALQEAEEKYDVQKKQLDARLVATYEMGPTTYLDMLLKSKSLSDFLSNYYRISEIAKVDQSLIESFCDISRKVSALSATLNTNKKILEQSRVANEEAKIVLENLKIVQDGKVQLLSEEDRAIHETIEAYQAELEAVEAEIRLLSLACVGAEYVGGVMAWPVPGYTRITSPYGMRTHPITGIYKLHTGTDIGAPFGADFIAANDGIVIKAGYNGAYGNMVILDHGGGIQTLYAHGSQILVEEGQIISSGTPVLKVGATGYATGPHAHFEVRINGDPVEPLDYITSYGAKVETDTSNNNHDNINIFQTEEEKENEE